MNRWIKDIYKVWENGTPFNEVLVDTLWNAHPKTDKAIFGGYYFGHSDATVGSCDFLSIQDVIKIESMNLSNEEMCKKFLGKEYLFGP